MNFKLASLAILAIPFLLHPQTANTPPTPLPAPAALSTCDSQAFLPILDRQYIFQQNEWNSKLPQCAAVSTTAVSFSLTTANFHERGGAPANYPSIFVGCHWSTCSNPAQSHMPLQENRIASATTSVAADLVDTGDYDVAYDIWFDQNAAPPAQPHGTEIMIWINHRGFPRPFGAKVATVALDGLTWDVWVGHQQSWNIISFVSTPGVSSVKNLDLLPFFADSIARGSLQPSWWLIDVEMGFEVWTGGQGLGIHDFSVEVRPRIDPPAQSSAK